MPIRNHLFASALVFASAAAIAQQPAEPAAKRFALDVVSIKTNNSGSRNGGPNFSTTGLKITNMTLLEIVNVAYLSFGMGSRIIGPPAWTQDERYDIVGHIDEASAPAWLKLSPGERYELGKPMLQKLLADRSKLSAHFEPTQIDGYTLVLSKRRTHPTPTKLGETYPDGVKNVDQGGKVLTTTGANGSSTTMQFFNVSITFLAYFLGARSGSVVQDQTNLPDRYDFTVRFLGIQRDPDGKPLLSNPQPADLWDISSTGLEFKHAKVPAQNLVIDHIERPTPN